jgi:hypothetical protein
MKTIILIILILLSISLVGLGYIESKPNSYDLKYNFDEGDVFAYDIVSSVEMPNKMVTPINVDMNILDINNTSITVKKISMETTPGNKIKKSHIETMTDQGEIIKLNSEDLILPEIQPEVPNTIIYPENQIHQGESWTIPFKRANNLTTAGMLTSYELLGTNNYTCIGFKNVSVRAGSFECVGIESDSNFTLNMVTKTSNGTVYTTIAGKESGKNWVDLNSGVLVKSEYDVDKVIKTDLSEIYEEIGLEKCYKETPIDSHIISELVNFKEG